MPAQNARPQERSNALNASGVAGIGIAVGAVVAVEVAGSGPEQNAERAGALAK